MTKEQIIEQAGTLLIETIKAIKDFSIKEVPPFIQELVRWQVTKDSIGVGVFFFLTAIFIALLCFWLKHMNYNPKLNVQHWIYKENCEPWMIAWIIGSILNFGGLYIFGLHLLKYHVAPKVYTIEVIKSLF